VFFKEILLGGAISYSSYSPVTTPSFGATANSISSDPYYGLQVYGDITVGSGELLPMIAYQWLIDSDANGLTQSDFDKLAIALAYRLTY